MSHRLFQHPSLCKNIHGHEYVLIVAVSRKDGGLDERGMVMDFSDLKKLVNKTVVDKLDHAFMLNMNDAFSVAIYELSKTPEVIEKLSGMKWKDEFGSKGIKVVKVDFTPTAENMAKWIYERIKAYFFQEGELFLVKNIEIYETPDSSVIYEEKLPMEFEERVDKIEDNIEKIGGSIDAIHSFNDLKDKMLKLPERYEAGEFEGFNGASYEEKKME